MSGRVNDARLPLDDRRLKRATRELVKVVGGASEAAAITGKRQQRISEAQLANCPEWLDLGAIIRLEEDARGSGDGWPHITRAQARHHGFELLECAPLPEHVDWHSAMARAAKEYGEANAALLTALPDGISADEIRRGNIVGEIDQALCALVHLRGLAVAVEREGEA